MSFLAIIGVRSVFNENRTDPELLKQNRHRIVLDTELFCVISETLEGFTCNCPDFVKTRSARGSRCKHLLAVFAVGLLDGQKGGAR